MSILDEIVERNRPDLATAQRRTPLAAIRREAEESPPPRPYRAVLEGPTLGVIAEIKPASPSRGILRSNLDVAGLARTFVENRCSCLSVLTEPHYFLGNVAYLAQARAASHAPILRKDFLVDPYQVYEARARGADAVLLIVAILETSLLRELIALAAALHLGAQVEVHEERELEAALVAGADLIGINNRDLRDLSVDLGTTERLMTGVPRGVVTVSESGIRTQADVAKLAACGVSAIHVGETLMVAADPGAALAHLVSYARQAVAP